MEIPKEKILDTLRVSGRHVSVDAPFVEGEDNSLLDVLVNNDFRKQEVLLLCYHIILVKTTVRGNNELLYRGVDQIGQSTYYRTHCIA